MSSITRTSRHRTSGFSLVEIMVGMVIGMLGIMVIMQVYSVFESQKRATTGAGDAQNAGAIALFGMQRDIEQAGYGLSTSNIIGCNVQLRAGPPAVTVTLAPVTINPASSVVPTGDSNTDTLLIAYGSSASPPEGNGITSLSGSNYAVQAYGSFTAGDQVIAMPSSRPSPCSLTLTSVTAVNNPNVTVATAVAGVGGGALYNLGTTPVVKAYAVRSGNLTVCDYMTNDCSQNNSAIWVPVANNIISMRAEYGQDANNPMDGILDGYGPTTPSTACGWLKTSAVRLALVARNTEPGNTAVTASAPTWAGSATTAINLTGTTVASGKTWQNYRYKVFETTVPIQNISLQGVVSGC